MHLRIFTGFIISHQYFNIHTLEPWNNVGLCHWVCSDWPMYCGTKVGGWIYGTVEYQHCPFIDIVWWTAGTTVFLVVVWHLLQCCVYSDEWLLDLIYCWNDIESAFVNLEAWRKTCTLTGSIHCYMAHWILVWNALDTSMCIMRRLKRFQPCKKLRSLPRVSQIIGSSSTGRILLSLVERM